LGFFGTIPSTEVVSGCEVWYVGALGSQCQAEAGDWYARGMYQEGDWQYKYHVEKFGHPSKFGFKDIIHEWKAEKWNPDELVTLYKNTGAKYFIGMANHHDNFDMYDSKYQKNGTQRKWVLRRILSLAGQKLPKPIIFLLG
jgi:hypothetical protein